MLRLTCAQLWDLRAKRSAHTMSEDYQILAVAFAEAGDQVYTGGIENVIKVCATLRVPHHLEDSFTTMQCHIACFVVAVFVSVTPSSTQRCQGSFGKLHLPHCRCGTCARLRWP